MRSGCEKNGAADIITGRCLRMPLPRSFRMRIPHTASCPSENFGEMNFYAAQNVTDYLEERLADKYRVV